ncbi:hypothetical protein ACFRDV_27160 [Streptomyces fagopyri]|uniref:hypothetical protein n=1 Tax=Streptomyces fagopyri TaxID=2662397 RepID=UPI0036BA3782
MADMKNTAILLTPLSITQTITAGTRVLIVGGEIDYDSAEMLRQALHLDDSRPARFMLDLSAVNRRGPSFLAAVGTDPRPV